MSDLVPALQNYVRLLQREGIPHVALSRAARQGLKSIQSPAPSPRVTTPASTAPARASTPVSRTTPLPSPTPSTTPTSLPLDLSGLDLKSGTKAERLDRLRPLVLNCQRCPHLASTRTQAVFGVGNPEAELMFIGEAPGADEDEQGEPFVGKAGQLLTKMIQAMGLQREQVYIANILKCRPDMPTGSTGNRKPTLEEMKTCHPYLEAQLAIIQPKALVALGATAIEGLLNEKTPISKLRGKLMMWNGIPLMPTYHPAYLLRNQSVAEKRKVWEDLLLVMESLKLPISEKQRGFFLNK